MKRPARCLLLLLLVIVVTTCKKKDEYPKVYPGSYFPVYPGSYWHYRQVDFTTADTLPADWTTSADYQPDRYPTAENTYSDYKLVPILNGVAIYGYRQMVCVTAIQCWLAPFLSEQPGDRFNWPEVRKYNVSYTRWDVISKGVDLRNDSVLVLKGKDLIAWQSINNKVYWKYYRKNVGLVESYVIDTTTNDTIFKQYLTEYHVSFKR